MTIFLALWSLGVFLAFFSILGIPRVEDRTDIFLFALLWPILLPIYFLIGLWMALDWMVGSAPWGWRSRKW
jgi:hypothetical protein